MKNKKNFLKLLISIVLIGSSSNVFCMKWFKNLLEESLTKGKLRLINTQLYVSERYERLGSKSGEKKKKLPDIFEDMKNLNKAYKKKSEAKTEYPIRGYINTYKIIDNNKDYKIKFKSRYELMKGKIKLGINKKLTKEERDLLSREEEIISKIKKRLIKPYRQEVIGLYKTLKFKNEEKRISLGLVAKLSSDFRRYHPSISSRYLPISSCCLVEPYFLRPLLKSTKNIYALRQSILEAQKILFKQKTSTDIKRQEIAKNNLDILNLSIYALAELAIVTKKSIKEQNGIFAFNSFLAARSNNTSIKSSLTYENKNLESVNICSLDIASKNLNKFNSNRRYNKYFYPLYISTNNPKVKPPFSSEFKKIQSLPSEEIKFIQNNGFLVKSKDKVTQKENDSLNLMKQIENTIERSKETIFPTISDISRTPYCNISIVTEKNCESKTIFGSQKEAEYEIYKIIRRPH